MLNDEPGPNEAETGHGDDGSDALVAALVDLERYVGGAGWDSAPRLFALVATDALILAEPELAASLGLRSTADGAAPGGLTAIEQEDFTPSGDLVADLAAISWPLTVHGCAVSLESSFLPAGAEQQLPDDPVAAADLVAGHPDRVDVRLVVGVDRDGHRHGVGRVVTAPDELLGGRDLVPALADALAHTLS